MDLRHSQMILHLFYISLTNIVGIVKRKIQVFLIILLQTSIYPPIFLSVSVYIFDCFSKENKDKNIKLIFVFLLIFLESVDYFKPDSPLEDFIPVSKHPSHIDECNHNLRIYFKHTCK